MKSPAESVKFATSRDSKLSVSSSRAQRAKAEAVKAALMQQQAEGVWKIVELDMKRVEMRWK